MALALHPFIMGAPDRLRYVRHALHHRRSWPNVLFCTCEQIHDWLLGTEAGKLAPTSIVILSSLQCLHERSAFGLRRAGRAFAESSHRFARSTRSLNSSRRPGMGYSLIDCSATADVVNGPDSIGDL